MHGDLVALVSPGVPVYVGSRDQSRNQKTSLSPAIPRGEDKGSLDAIDDPARRRNVCCRAHGPDVLMSVAALFEEASAVSPATPSPAPPTDQALVDATHQLVTATSALAALTAALVFFTLMAPLLIWWLQRRQRANSDKAALRLVWMEIATNISIC